MKKSTYIPLLLVVYLAVMSYIGRAEFYAGNYFYYFGIIGVTLVCILLLHLFMKKRDRVREERRNNIDSRR
jgi:Na+/melibiose symporter-like transporter